MNKRTVRFVFFSLITLAIAGSSIPTLAQESQTTKLFLPLVANSEGEPSTPTPTASPSPSPSPSPTPTATPTTTPPREDAGAVMFGEASHRSAAVAVDAQGGMHVAFSKTAPFLPNEQAAVFYGYCAPGNLAACGESSGWRLVEIDTHSEGWPWIQLQLTPDGAPRLLLMRHIARDGVPFGGLRYRYAACDRGCTTAANWAAIDVLDQATGALYATDYSYRTFALDPAGHPRFIYEDRANSAGDHAGAYYVFCDEQCTVPGSWFETRIDASGDTIYVDEHAQLLFTSASAPRIFARDGGSFADPASKLVYVACNTACEQSANWSLPTRLLSTNAGSSIFTWSAALDAQARPRLTVYPRGGPFYYIWCNSTCTDSEQWEGYSLELEPGSGDYSALVLDAQGHPRVAYRDGSGFQLGYGWCDSACESLAAQWQFAVAEESDQIGAEHPIRPLPTCVRGGWFGGLRPSLALDSAGNPRIAYDGEYKMECRVNPADPNDPRTTVETKWWTSRLVFFTQP